MALLAGLNFKPLKDLTDVIDVTTSSAGVSFNEEYARDRQVRLYNDGSATVFVRVSKGIETAVVATSGQIGDMAIPAGAIEVFNLGANYSVSAIAASGTATLYITLGEGRG